MKVKDLNRGDVSTTTNDRYRIVRDSHEVECDHPMCWQLHQRFMQRYEYGVRVYDPSADRRVDRFHMTTRSYWLIIDTQTGQRAFDGDCYDTKREAVAALARNLTWSVFA